MRLVLSDRRKRGFETDNMAGFLGGTLSHDSHLGLILDFDPWLPSHLLFLPSLLKKEGTDISFLLLCLIYLECQIFVKKSLLTTELMHHGAAFSAGVHRNYMKAKEIRERNAKGKVLYCAR